MTAMGTVIEPPEILRRCGGAGANPPTPARFHRVVAASIRESLRVKRQMLGKEQVAAISAVARVLVDAFRRGAKVLVFGNGGSAADAQHFAAELVGKYCQDRPPLPALALTVNTSCLTAIGNDYSFAGVFARQVEALGHPGDVAVGISTSGSSANVLEGLKAARGRGLTTVALTGTHGGAMDKLADYCLKVPSAETPRIQEAHTLIVHSLSAIVEQELFREEVRLG